MKKLKTARMAVTVAALSLMTAACGSNSDSSGGGLDEFRYMVPNSAGSGWDLTARTASKIMEDDGIASRIDVFNVDGANGTVGLSRLASDDGNGEIVMQMGFGLVAATVSQSSKVTFDDTTPIAKLIDDYPAVVVPGDSPIGDLDDLIAAWKKNPRLKVGGGSSIGGADHLSALLMAEANGLKRSDVNYVTFGGSGVLPAVLGGQVDVAVTSAVDVVEQVKAGELKAIAVTGEERFSGLPDVPTLTENGTDVVVANWRGVVAPPGLDNAEKEALIAAFDKMHASAGWESAVERNGWVDAYITGDEFSTYLKDQAVQIDGALKGLDK